ncbi:MAG TPA: DUF5696 domain-containing protein [Planctomycetota bacterium]|nr:DUF5696 domain-containing protein [Planctomycetota bacterium]
MGERVMQLAVWVALVSLVGGATVARGETLRLESEAMRVEADSASGRWALLDKASGVRWPSAGEASPGASPALLGGFSDATAAPEAITLSKRNGAGVRFALVDGGRTLEVSYKDAGEVRALADALRVTDAEGGYLVVPCREGLLLRADSGRSFQRTFGTSEYEGCHMNMLGLVKAGSALVVSWDDAYVFPEVQSVQPREAAPKQHLTTTLALRRSANVLRLTPLGKGDWNTLAAGYRRIAEGKGIAATLRAKIQRNAKAELMLGAANVKLWTCLARKRNEESTADESVKVRWTFDEAAQIAEHLRKDLGIERCLFILGGWTEGGYDCRHPDNLPANPECGGNAALADAVRRIQALGYLACLHDNVQDMYRDAKSWNPAFIEKDAKGELVKGGRWLGGRAYMVCAPKQLELAQRPQNLPETQKLFAPWSYFIDTTYAVGPRECHDPAHPLGRNDDIAWKIKLSAYARDVFGLFGSECGREWALPCSDFFEGLVGVSGKYFHSLDPASLGAIVIPFWEMVYHDCQVAYGKYGYAAEQAAEYVAHHVLCARPLHYHSVPDHLYWKQPAPPGADAVAARPRVVSVEAAEKGAFRIRYAWDVEGDVAGDWRVFVHFGTDADILFQDDHAAAPPTSQWKKGQTVELGPRTVAVPPNLRAAAVDVYMGLFSPTDVAGRARLPGADGQRRVLAGRLVLKPELKFEPRAASAPALSRSAFTRCDGGWAEGLHPTDVFLKNTHEVLGPLNEATAHRRLTRLELLKPDGSLRRAVYGEGKEAVAVVVNFGAADAEADSTLGGRVVLPPWGFVAEAPRFAAFYAKSWGGQSYPEGALFTVRAAEGDTLAAATQVRVFHGFGQPTLAWRGTRSTVPREATLRVP